MAEAGTSDLWPYINPDSDGIELPALPTPPAAVDNTEDIELFKMRFQLYREQYNRAKIIVELHQKLMNHILESIDSRHLFLLRDNTKVYNVLKALKGRLSPSNRTKQLDVIGQYHKLMRPTKGTKVEEWLQRWETTYQKAMDLGLGEVSGNRPQFDFLLALQQYDASFSNTYEALLNNKLDENRSIPSLYELVDQFRNHQRMQSANSTYISHSAFPTFKGQDQNDTPSGQEQPNINTNLNTNSNSNSSSESNTNSRRKWKCICGRNHRYSDCWFLIPSNRPKDWQPKQEILDKIKTAINADSKLRDNINKAIEYMAKKASNSLNSNDLLKPVNPTNSSNSTNANTSIKEDQNQPILGAYFMGYPEGKYNTNLQPINQSKATFASAFTTRDSWSLKYTWILDSGSNIHVTNSDKNLKITHIPDQIERLTAGQGTCNIAAYGTATIEVKTPHGKGYMELQNVAYIPGFITNLVSLSKLTTKILYWDTQKDRLYIDGVT